MTALARPGLAIAAATIVAILLLVAGLAAPAGALPPEACAAPDKLRAAGETKQARKDYIALLRQDPALTCAQSGLSAINDPAPSSAGVEAQALCDRGAAYVDLDREDDALKAYKAALEKDPKLPCAIAGVEEAGPSAAGRLLDKITDALPQYLLALGLLVTAFFAVLLLGHIKLFYGMLVQGKLSGRILSPRLTLEKLVDNSDLHVGDPLAARIKERLVRTREEASRADAAFELDFGTPPEDLAIFVGGDSGLKSAIDKASEATEQTKTIGAIVNLFYAILPIPRLTVAGVVEPPGASACATLRLEKNGGLAASVTVQGPEVPGGGAAGASDFLQLADPSAVWVGYEVARALQGGDALGPHAAESYANVREGLDQQLAGNYREARAFYESAQRLYERNWAAQVNLGMTEARLEKNYDRAVEILATGFDRRREP